MTARLPLTILLGPPRTGKTTRVLDRYRALAGAGVEPRRILFLVPTGLAVEAVTERLMRLSGAPASLAGARIMTFERLAHEILRRHHPKAIHLSALSKRLLLEDIVERLRAPRRGSPNGAGATCAGAVPLLDAVPPGMPRAGTADGFTYYARIAATAGFVDTLADLFGEFKRHEITPERLEEMVAGGRWQVSGTSDPPKPDPLEANPPKPGPLGTGNRSPKDRETLAIYAAYQRRLKEADAYDTEGELWRVRDLLAAGRREPFDDLHAILLDGFHSFTATQLQVLPLLAAGAEEVLCALPGDPDAGRRPDLFDAVRRTISQLREHFTVTVKPIRRRRPAGPPPQGCGHLAGALDAPRSHNGSGPPAALDALADGLFDDSATPAATGPGPPVRLLEAPGAAGEVSAIARHIKRLVVEEGRRPDEIAVVVRSAEPYRAAFESTFTAFGIPFRTASNPGADTVPVVRFVLDCLQTLAAGWPWRRTAALAKSSYLPPGTIDGDGLDLALRLAGAAEGYQAHLDGLHRALAHLDEEIARRDGDDQEEQDNGEAAAPSDPRRRRAAVAAALDDLPRLAALLGDWPDPAPWTVFLDATRDLVRHLDLIQEAGRFPADRLLPLGGRRDDLLGLAALEHVLDELTAIHQSAPDPISLADYAEHLRRALSAVGIDRPSPRDGAVALLDAYEARALRFPVVFVAGLLEGLFPRGHREHPFYGEWERGRLRERGLWLPRRDEAQREEMFLFLMAVTRADVSLFLTYPYVDELGRPNVISGYLEEVRRLLPEALVERTRPVEAAPPWDLVACEADLRLRTAADLCAPAPDSEAASAGLRLLNARHPEALRTLLQGAAVERERESLRPPGRFDGTVADAALVESLAAAYPPERAVSATTLDRYRACPFAFFLGHLLGSEALPEPQEDFPPAERGRLLHRVVAQFCRRREFRPVTEADRHQAQALIAELAEAQFRHLERVGLAPTAGLWRMHQDEIRRTLERFVEAELAETTWRPRQVEVTFGHQAPCRLRIGERALSIHGRIDRVDVRADGSAGLRVIDYKGGADVPKPTKRLQLPLYLAAALQLFPQRSAAAEADYYRLRGQVGPTIGPRTRINWDETIREAIQGALDALDAIRAGRFVPAPEGPDEPCRWCDWQHVCRHDGQRLDAKKTEDSPRRHGEHTEEESTDFADSRRFGRGE